MSLFSATNQEGPYEQSYTTAYFAFYRGSTQATTKFPPLSELRYETEERRRVHLHLTKLVTWSNRYEGERTRIFSTTFSLPSPSSDLKVANDGEKGKPFNIFQKVAIRKTRCHHIWEKSTFWKLGFFFTSSPHETTAGRTLLNQLLALYSFYTWFLTFRDAQQGELS